MALAKCVGDPTPPPPYNSTTILVTWTSGVGTETIMAEVQTQISAMTKPTYDISAHSYSSLGYTYIVFTSTDIGPVAIAKGFTDTTEVILPQITAANHIPI